jgi:hypothetical protein
MIFTTTAIAGLATLALWMGVLSQHPIPTAPMPPCAIGYLVPYHDALRCVDPTP